MTAASLRMFLPYDGHGPFTFGFYACAMDRALFAAASGMAAQQRNLDTISDNLANSEVAGFKGSAEEFAALAAPGERSMGTIPLGRHVVFTQGKLERSNGPCDLAIDGNGFFVVRDGKRVAYTRDGEFSRAADGTLRNAAGWQLDGVRIPADALSVNVGEDGAVSATTASGATKRITTISLASFAAPERLESIGGTLFVENARSGRARLFHPSTNGAAQIRFGMLEQSNVSIVESMMQILTAQRAYEANAKGVQAADEMLRIANNLQRG
ncbi:MAG: flagellar hook-basal body complex protein [Candidatus Eremiobacteraeota bacterium]|nr:flagellar hook-basal body complex protein [Candidatus Eremiobacteraeota bacterium]